MQALGRNVNAYLDLAEERAQRKIPMTMEDWAKRLDAFLEFTEREVLRDAGKVTAEIAKAHAESEFEKYRIVQDRLFESDFDRVVKPIEAEHQAVDTRDTTSDKLTMPKKKVNRRQVLQTPADVLIWPKSEQCGSQPGTTTNRRPFPTDSSATPGLVRPALGRPAMPRCRARPCYRFSTRLQTGSTAASRLNRSVSGLIYLP